MLTKITLRCKEVTIGLMCPPDNRNQFSKKYYREETQKIDKEYNLIGSLFH